MFKPVDEINFFLWNLSCNSMFQSIFRIFFGFLSLGWISLFSYAKEQYVDFQPLINTSFMGAIDVAGALPVFLNYSNKQFQELFAEFIRGENLHEMSCALENWAPGFFLSEPGAPWKKSNYRFGIFGDKGSSHKKKRLINGINCKMCIEFCDWIREMHSIELKKIPHLARLLDRLTYIDEIAHEIFMSKITEIANDFPEINQIFYEYKGKPRLPITLRLIRFENSPEFTLPLHFDISVLSLIFPSDDPPLDECLIIAPANGTEFIIEHLKKALRPKSTDLNQSCGLLISGTLLNHLSIPIPPTPHGVVPHFRDSRCVIVACLHVPNLDTSEQSTLLSTLTEIPIHLRNSDSP